MNQFKARADFRNNYFFYAVLFLCLAYVAFEYYFIPFFVLSADEFVFARHIYEYTFHVPYRDFPPYKTVLGYYLLSLPMFFSHTVLQPLFYIKDEIAIINAVFMAFSCYLAASIFDKRAVLITILAIIANELFLVYATDLRVDMLTNWFCLLSSLYILKNRFNLSGFLLGIAFLISQKALWYVIAIDASILICCYAYKTSIFTLRRLIYFNLAILFPIVIYIIIWSLIASPSLVIYNLFYEAYIQAGINWYLPIYAVCWDAALRHGPVLFLLWPATMLMATEKLNDKDVSAKRVFIITYAFIALIQFVNYKQAFPYNFVFTIPAFFLLYSEFFSWLLAVNTSRLKVAPTLFSVFVVYALFIDLSLGILSQYLYPFSTIYYLSAFLPIALFSIFYFKNNYNLHFYRISIISFFTLFFTLGISYPLYNEIMTSNRLDGKYQQTTIELTSLLLKQEGSYIGGIPFLYQIDQPITGMKNLIGPALEYLYEPSDETGLLLLPSLYLAPSNQEKVIADFERTPVKVILNNYRIEFLPYLIKSYINNHYQHFYGSIYLYAPIVSPSQLSFDIKFSGNYRVQANKTVHIRIDNKIVHARQLLTLKKGDHTSFANGHYRLVFVPNIARKDLPADFNNDEWVRMIKAIVG